MTGGVCFAAKTIRLGEVDTPDMVAVPFDSTISVSEPVCEILVPHCRLMAGVDEGGLAV